MKSPFLGGISTNKWENALRVLNVCMGRMVLGKNAQGRELLKFCDEKELCMANTWFYKGVIP